MVESAPKTPISRNILNILKGKSSTYLSKLIFRKITITNTFLAYVYKAQNEAAAKTGTYSEEDGVK